MLFCLSLSPSASCPDLSARAKIPEVVWAGSGALLLIILRLTPLTVSRQGSRQRATTFTCSSSGMMLLSELAREQGSSIG